MKTTRPDRLFPLVYIFWTHTLLLQARMPLGLERAKEIVGGNQIIEYQLRAGRLQLGARRPAGGHRRRSETVHLTTPHVSNRITDDPDPLWGDALSRQALQPMVRSLSMSRNAAMATMISGSRAPLKETAASVRGISGRAKTSLNARSTALRPLACPRMRVPSISKNIRRTDRYDSAKFPGHGHATPSQPRRPVERTVTAAANIVDEHSCCLPAVGWTMLCR